MPVKPEETKKFEAFILEKIKDLRSVDYDPQQMVIWHYTDGKGLIGIIESGAIHATQVACLNDSTEIRYGANLLRSAFVDLKQKTAGDTDAQGFISQVLELTSDSPQLPAHAPSRFFVACFSTEADDLSQWRAYGGPGGENGYAIGFAARGFNGYPQHAVLRVNYDSELHNQLANQVAETTLQFYRDGLKARPPEEAKQWQTDFLEAWNEWIARLAPLVKDNCFKSENEFRIVHELTTAEYHEIRLSQKETLLSRYLPIRSPIWMQTRTTKLPVVKVIVGPSRHQAISRISVGVLLRQMGYSDVPIELSQRPLQKT